MNNVLNESAEVVSVSFHGSDGCGKSTLAKELADITRAEGGSVLELGGSSYRTWLDSTIAREFDCDTDLLSATILSPVEKILLYEDVAIACYGLMRRATKSEGVAVIIDSDPYLKRLAWAHASLPYDQFRCYANRFENKVAQRIGSVLPDHLVHVVSDDKDDITSQSYTLFERMRVRGKVSEYDPDTLEDTKRIVLATQAVWAHVLASDLFAQQPPILHHIVNGTYPDKDLPAAIKQQSRALFDTITPR